MKNRCKLYALTAKTADMNNMKTPCKVHALYSGDKSVKGVNNG
jgi:hypothetical protein